MGQFFICDQEEIKEKLATLIQSGVSDGGWTLHFTDPKTTDSWIATQHHAEYQGGGLSYLKKLPDLTNAELIDLCTSSENKDDILGSCYNLVQNENNGQEFRSYLVENLTAINKSHNSDFAHERLKMIIKTTELTDPLNRRNIVGKEIPEIMADAQYYQTISDKANNLLSEMNS